MIQGPNFTIHSRAVGDLKRSLFHQVEVEKANQILRGSGVCVDMRS